MAVAGGTQDLVLGAGALQGQLQTLVVRLQRVGAGFEGGELSLELADMALLALAEGTLAGGWSAIGQAHSDCSLGRHVRCAVLGLPPALGGCEVRRLLLLAAAAGPAGPVVQVGAEAAVDAAGGQGGVGHGGLGRALRRGQGIGEGVERVGEEVGVDGLVLRGRG